MEAVPKDLKREISRFLDAYDAQAVFSINKDFAKVGMDDGLWREIVQRIFAPLLHRKLKDEEHFKDQVINKALVVSYFRGGGVFRCGHCKKVRPIGYWLCSRSIYWRCFC